MTISTEKLIMNQFFFPIFLEANPYMLLGLTKKSDESNWGYQMSKKPYEDLRGNWLVGVIGIVSNEFPRG